MSPWRRVADRVIPAQLVPPVLVPWALRDPPVSFGATVTTAVAAIRSLLYSFCLGFDTPAKPRRIWSPWPDVDRPEGMWMGETLDEFIHRLGRPMTSSLPIPSLDLPPLPFVAPPPRP